MSIVELLKAKGYNVSERRISIDEIVEAYKTGKLEEAWGTGTAAVISPIGELKYGDLVMPVNNGEIGEVSQMLYDTPYRDSVGQNRRHNELDGSRIRLR